MGDRVGSSPTDRTIFADMAELADAHGSGPCECKFMQVQVLLSAPNKFDSFDTRVSETINLFLFTKMPVAIHIFMIYSNIIQ